MSRPDSMDMCIPPEIASHARCSLFEGNRREIRSERGNVVQEGASILIACSSAAWVSIATYAWLPPGYAIYGHSPKRRTPCGMINTATWPSNESRPYLGCYAKRTFVRRQDSTDLEGGRILVPRGPRR
jgi:hypothetical protein